MDKLNILLNLRQIGSFICCQASLTIRHRIVVLQIGTEAKKLSNTDRHGEK